MSCTATSPYWNEVTGEPMDATASEMDFTNVYIKRPPVLCANSSP